MDTEKDSQADSLLLTHSHIDSLYIRHYLSTNMSLIWVYLLANAGLIDTAHSWTWRIRWYDIGHSTIYCDTLQYYSHDDLFTFSY